MHKSQQLGWLPLLAGTMYIATDEQTSWLGLASSSQNCITVVHACIQAAPSVACLAALTRLSMLSLTHRTKESTYPRMTVAPDFGANLQSLSSLCSLQVDAACCFPIAICTSGECKIRSVYTCIHDKTGNNVFTFQHYSLCNRSARFAWHARGQPMLVHCS